MEQRPFVTACSRADRSALRLRVRIGEESRSYFLARGDNRVGADSACSVVLSVRGVSRQHAILRVGEETVEISDLGSKNGTFVNGARVQKTTVEVGQELRFGPVRAALERVDADDATLGISMGASDRGDASVAAAMTASTVSELGSSSRGGELNLAEAIFDRISRQPEPDLEGALVLLIRRHELQAAAAVEWQQKGDTVVLGAVGDPGCIPPMPKVLSSGKARRPGVVHVLSRTEATGPSGVCLGSPKREVLGLLVWGASIGEEICSLLSLVLRFIERFRTRRIVALSPEPASASFGIRLADDIVAGESPAMVSLYQQMQLVLQGDVPVLILGETGVGKEHLACALHDSSQRADKRFVAINCAAIPGDLLEAELFGIGQGVATGVRARTGRFIEADGGTIFLDEIGDMSADLQAKLLRTVQEGEVYPLGEAAVPVDVRIIAATNADLHRRMEDGSFRRDLFYRLAGYVLEVPPLRERREDVPTLIGHFISVFARETNKVVTGVTVKALRALVSYSWPGNVRHLEHEVRRLVYKCPDGQAICFEMLPNQISFAVADEGYQGLVAGVGLKPQVEQLERRLIRQALARTAGNVTQAAKILEVSRNGLHKRLARLGIKTDPYSYRG